MTSLTGCSGEDFNAILCSLGYRVERKPAPKPVEAPALEAVAAAPDAEAPGAPVVETPAEALLAEFVAGTPADAAPAEPAMIEIWRPGRAEHRRPEAKRTPRPAAPAADGAPVDDKPRRARRPDKMPGKDFKGGFKGGPRNKGPRREERPDAKRPPAPERRERVADPNSPFAALAGLKARLEGDKT
jgi:ATP-dependent RNA helicase SUPV3L1/SUV3